MASYALVLVIAGFACATQARQMVEPVAERTLDTSPMPRQNFVATTTTQTTPVQQAVTTTTTTPTNTGVVRNGETATSGGGGGGDVVNTDSVITTTTTKLTNTLCLDDGYVYQCGCEETNLKPNTFPFVCKGCPLLPEGEPNRLSNNYMKCDGKRSFLLNDRVACCFGPGL